MHLCDALKDGHAVYAADIAFPDSLNGRIERFPVTGTPDSLANTIRSIKPDCVVHAAFLNRKPDNMVDGQYLAHMNDLTIAVFSACAAVKAKVIITSSSAVYGNAHNKLIIDEDTCLAPVTIYGAAKASQEILAHYWGASYGLPYSVCRIFNLIGPGQKEGMLLPDWTCQVARFGDKKEPALKVRTLATWRDFIDARDAAACIRLMVDGFKPGITVNIASGTAVSLRDICTELQALSPVHFRVEEENREPRKDDVSRQAGSFTLARITYGWSPRISWQTSLKDLWNTYV